MTAPGTDLDLALYGACYSMTAITTDGVYQRHRLVRVDPRCVTMVVERDRTRFDIEHEPDCGCGDIPDPSRR